MKHSKSFTFLIVLIMTACGMRATSPSVEIISPQEFKTRLQEAPNAYLLDVRKPDEFAAGHLKGAHLLNWLDTDSFKHEAEKIDKAKTIYVYCRSGPRSNEAACYLADIGYNVVEMEGGILAWEEHDRPIVAGSDNAVRQMESQGIGLDFFKTQSGKDVKIHFIKHASLIFEVDGKMIYIDPTGMFGNNFSKLPKADVVMVTHEHHDHYDPAAIEAVSKSGTRFICNGRVAELSGKGEIMQPGDTLDVLGVKVTATPSYNITEGHLQFHPRDHQGVGAS